MTNICSFCCDGMTEFHNTTAGIATKVASTVMTANVAM